MRKNKLLKKKHTTGKMPVGLMAKMAMLHAE